MTQKPDDLIDQVTDLESFLVFLEALARDRQLEDDIEAKKPSSPYGPGAMGWENGTIATFLDAAAAVGRAHLAKGGVISDANPWMQCADVLLAGKYYE